MAGKPKRDGEAGEREPITETMLSKLALPEAGQKTVWCGGLSGFGVRVSSTGTIAFFVDYWTRARIRRRQTIGRWPAWSVKKAREEAKNILQAVDMGGDPLGAEHLYHAAPTVDELAQLYIERHLPKKRPSSQRNDRSMLTAIILPRFGRMKVADVTHADIERLHAELSRVTPARANRVAALLSKMWSLAKKWGFAQGNPVEGLERNSEIKRERFLRPEELAALFAALNDWDGKGSADAIRLLVLTGARRGEMLGATWDQFDFDAGVWVKPSSHTKQKRTHRVPLSSAALQILTRMRTDAEEAAARKAKENGGPENAPAVCPFLFPAPSGDKPQGDLKKFWAKAVERATVYQWEAQTNAPSGALVARLNGELKRRPTFQEVVRAAEAANLALPPGLMDVHVHDLRHSYASYLASAGLSLTIIGQLLGHTQPATTARYAHLLDDPLRQATERAAAAVAAATGGGKGADVVSLSKRRERI